LTALTASPKRNGKKRFFLGFDFKSLCQPITPAPFTYNAASRGRQSA
jgi:hypothetical protein